MVEPTRTRVVFVRMSASEKSELARLAQDRGLSGPELIRQLVRALGGKGNVVGGSENSP